MLVQQKLQIEYKTSRLKTYTMENLDWKNIGFGYRDTDYNVRCYYRDGKWGELGNQLIKRH